MFQSVCLFAMAARHCLLVFLLLLIAMSSRTTAVTFTQGAYGRTQRKALAGFLFLIDKRRFESQMMTSW
jgi:hypothetical protein